MKINTNEFCALSTVPSFQSWLYSTDATLATELLDHLKKSLGCAANKQKMTKILSVIQSNGVSNASLLKYLNANFPSIIINDTLPVRNKHGVFPYFDSALVTIPRRVILTNLDAARSSKSLQELVESFCAIHAKCEHVIVEDHAYIEYIPRDLSHILNIVPETSWHVKNFKTKR